LAFSRPVKLPKTRQHGGFALRGARWETEIDWPQYARDVPYVIENEERMMQSIVEERARPGYVRPEDEHENLQIAAFERLAEVSGFTA
jgi:hypothetical protein